MKQIFNPYLPSFEYVPDGEPHAFNGRIYIYGSHDRFHGAFFCMNDYICYSAPQDDLTDWRYEGVIYRKDQDPRNQTYDPARPEIKMKANLEPVRPQDLNPPHIHSMWAPDVVQGPDGKYYLYYCLDCLPEIGVAVCDTPAGSYEFLGFVHHEDGILLGLRSGDRNQFDPGIFVDDDGEIYLYSGNGPRSKEPSPVLRGSQVMKLQSDMVTLKEEPRLLIPDMIQAEGTPYEGHEFFEASSIRKINGKYYFVYSSVRSHELCYAVSDRADGKYEYGGTLVDIGDIFLHGRTDEEGLNPLGNTHGGIECANGQWYVFYHRQTARTNYSRQACAEKIEFDAEGRIAQAEVTSCGLNRGPLTLPGTYQARICCHLTGEKGVVLSVPALSTAEYPYLTQDADDLEPTEELIRQDREIPFQYVANLQQGCLVGYKYFEGKGSYDLRLELRGSFEGTIELFTQPIADHQYTFSPDVQPVASFPVLTGAEWKWTVPISVNIENEGAFPIYFRFKGKGTCDFRHFSFC